MVFSEPLFLFVFLPLFLALYYLLPFKAKNLLLFLCSLIFYSLGEGWLVLIMLASTITDYSAGILISQGYKRVGLILSLSINLGLLIVFKYSNFLFENYNNVVEFLGLSSSLISTLPNIALPIGISFYTFQTMSYTIDVYRGNTTANRNFINFGAYVTMFPQLIAGPIVRYVDIMKQLEHRSINIQLVSQGAERFLLGFIKKMMFANSCGYIADRAFSYNAYDLNTSTAWIGIVAYSLQIYLDFSAYSDMAIGLSKMLGFDLPENFNYPYISKSVKEFWRRWHISLSTWFRDYLYIPLGGNRHGLSRTYFNLILVFIVTGVWHGASWNFIIWGLFHGMFLIIERNGLDRMLKSLPSVVSHAYLLMVVIVGWVFFRADNLSIAVEYIKAMLGFNNGTIHYSVILNNDLMITLVISLIVCLPIFPKIRSYIANTTSNLHIPYNAIYLSSLFFCIVYSLGLVAADTYNPFIYFRF